MRNSLLLAALFTACGPPSTRECIAEHPAGASLKVDNPYHLGVPTFECPYPPQNPGDCKQWPADLPMPDSAFLRTLYQCAVDGQTCDPHAWISGGAARCIASANGLKDGLDGLSSVPAYDHERRIAVWDVSNLLTDGGPDLYAGQQVELDAVSGNILSTHPYGPSGLRE